MVTGIDIVREQILIAAGNKLSLVQDEIKQNGHAIECRIYAEDPSNNFLPSPGEMSFYREPAGDNIRIDTGIAEATTIHSFYDPMIGKMIVWGEDREIARKKSVRAFRDYTVHGIKTNIAFLIQVLQNKAYIGNKISTGYCDEHTGDLIGLIESEKAGIAKEIPALAYLVYSFHEDLLFPDTPEYNVWKEIGYWRDLMAIKLDVDGDEIPVNVIKSKNGFLEFTANSKSYHTSLRSMETGVLDMVIDGRSMAFYISGDKNGQGYVSCNGHIFNVRRNDILVQEDVFGTLDTGGKDGAEIVSPMPGKVIKINVKEGNEVKKGDVLMVVEAMKMENNITAPRAGKVDKIQVKAGDMVDGSKELVVLTD
jgi:acetyl/propionyl-CoA carboxylase alpha subunit